jgi:N-methylhydantoinase A/oxoprolinase/acetone carboxylase beta subunit
METVIIPPAAGVGAAAGLLASNMKYDRQATSWQVLDRPDCEQIQSVIDDLREQTSARLQRDSFGPENSEIVFKADCRYVGQGYELSVTLPGGEIDLAWCRKLTEQFHLAHERAYNRRFDDKPVMIVNLGASGIGTVEPLQYPTVSCTGDGECQAESGVVYFPAGLELLEAETRFIRRESLGADSEMQGPVIIEQSDTTSILGPGTTLRVGRFGHLLVSMGAARPDGADS